MNWALPTRSYFPTVRKWRWDLIAVGVVALAAGIASTHPSAYFLHFDTPTQDMAALEWAHGCWEWNTEKILPVMLLGLLFKIFPPSPYVETVVLLLFMATSVTTAYELTRLFTQSSAGGWFTVLLLLSLPAFQFFSKTYLGYPIPLLLLGWLAIYKDKWGWGGICFGLAITAHFSAVLTVGISILALCAFYLRVHHIRRWLRFVATLVVPWLASEALVFAYTGRVFGLTSDTVHVLGRLSGFSAVPQPNWLWMPQGMIGSNGLLLSILLATGILAPLLIKQDRTLVAFALASIGVAIVFIIQGGLGRSILLTKTFAPLYPFWATCAAIALNGTLRRISPGKSMRYALQTILAVTLIAHAGHTTLFIRQFTRTLFPEIEKAFALASQQQRPVIYGGVNVYAALYFARAYDVETLTRLDQGMGVPEGAVLITEHNTSTAAPKSNYSIVVFESVIDASQYPALTLAATSQTGYTNEYISQIEIWWPTQPPRPINYTGERSFPHLYYSGTGCITQPWYGNGTMHFYQLVWKKLTGIYGK